MRIRGFDRLPTRAAIVMLVLIIGLSALAPIITPYFPNQIDMRSRLQNPSISHWLGTDQMGRDLLTRTIYGGRISISLAFLSSFCSLLVGLIIGLLSGYFGKWMDSLFLLITNVMQGLPSLAFMIALASVMGPGIRSILLAITLTSWTGFSRIIRGEVLKIKKEDYIEGMRALGASRRYIIVRHIIPNLAGTAIIVFSVRVSRSILAIASLSFLGFGIQPPTPDWGVMVRDALNYFRSQPMLIIAPGMAVFLSCLSINLIGDALRDFFDTRLDNQR